MTGAGSLPFIAIQMAGTEKGLRDVLLGGAIANAIESAQHASHAHPLLLSYAGVRRHGAAVNGGEQAINSVEPAEPLAVERHYGGNGLSADGENLHLRAIAERNHGMGALSIDLLARAFEPIGLIAGMNEDGRRGGQDDDVGVILRQPVDGFDLGFDLWICREIATSSADGFPP